MLLLAHTSMEKLCWDTEEGWEWMHGLNDVVKSLFPKHEGNCKESREIVFVLAFKRNSSLIITQIFFCLWNIYKCSSYSFWSLRLWSNVVCLLWLMYRVRKWQCLPRAVAAAVESSHFLKVCRLAKQTLCQSEISWCDSSTPSSKWAPFSLPSHSSNLGLACPCGAMAADDSFLAINQLLKLILPLINNASFSGPQKLCRVPLLGLNMPALITQSRLRAQWVIGCAGDGRGRVVPGM